MIISDREVQSSWEALQAAPERPDSEDEEPVEHDPSDVPDGLLKDLQGASFVRPDRVEEARAFMEAGGSHAPDEVAAKMVGRLVADSLR